MLRQHFKKFASVSFNKSPKSIPFYALYRGSNIRLFSTDSDFDFRVEQTMEEISDHLTQIEDQLDDDFEFELSHGVLSIKCRGKSWVLNKQGPNKQIWWSSPISGPLRFEDKKESMKLDKSVDFLNGWKSTKNNLDLRQLLRDELLECTNVDIFQKN